MNPSYRSDTINASISPIRDKNLYVVFLITLMAVLGVSSLAPAFPRVAEAFGIAKSTVGLLIICFTLPGIFFTPILGVVADHYGRKRVLVPSLILFALAGGSCVFVRDFQILLLLRFFQGMGAAALGSLNITLIGDLFDGSRRTEAMGYNAGVLSVATAGYPFIGGLLASLAWYYPFVLPFFALPVGLIVLFGLKNPEPKQQGQFSHYLKNVLAIFKNRQVVLYLIVNLVVFIMLYGAMVTYVPFFLAERFQASEFIIGLVLAAVSVVTGLTSSQAGRLAKRFGERHLLTISFVFYAVAAILIVVIPSLKAMALPVIIYGIGQGLNMPSLQVLLTSLAPLEYRAAFMSVNGMVLRLGQTLGPLIMGIFYTLGGYTGTFLAASILALFIFVLLLLNPGRR